MAELPTHRMPRRQRAARRVFATSVLGVLVCALLSVVDAPTARAAGEPQVTVDDITVDEPRSDENGALPFTVVLASPAAEELTVPWRLYRGKPPARQTITATGTLVFAPGETVKALSLPLAHNPYDDKVPYHFTLEILPGWPNNDRYGIATVHDTTRDGYFSCDAVVEGATGVTPHAVYGKDCAAGELHMEGVSDDSGHLAIEEIDLQVVSYADNRVSTLPAVGDGGEAHLTVHGVRWRIAPGIVLRAATVTSDARIVCTAVDEVPLMEASSSVTGLSINGAPPLGTITDRHVIDLGPAGRIVLNDTFDHAVLITSWPNVPEPHRTITQSAILAHLTVPFGYAYLGQTRIGQIFGNPCSS
jgi:hypothetical protein